MENTEKKDNWFSSCYRKLFLDYHLQQTATGVGENFNAEKWAEQLHDAGVQGVSCFSKCGFGWSYYQKGEYGCVHPNLPKGMDLLEDTVRECHKRNIKVIAYYHTMGSEYYSKLHPECVITDANGKKEPHGICMLSRASEEEMLLQIGEIAKYYDIDGMFFDGTFADGSICYCEDCQKRYKQETGMDLPISNEGNEYILYVQWVMEAYKKLRKRITDVVHENNENVLVAINWCYSPRQVEQVADGIGFLSEDIGPANMLSYGSCVARYWALTEMPFDIMNHMSLKWWLEWGIKPANSLKQECAAILSNGGKTWVGYQMYPQYGVAPFLFETLKETFDYVKNMESCLIGSSVYPYVGVLHGEEQIHACDNGSFKPMSDESSLLGVHRALTFSGIHYNSCSDEVFLKYLNQFKVVIISGNQPVRADIIDSLEEYVKNGGNMLITGTSGLLDEKGNFVGNDILEKMIGAKISNDYPFSHGYIVLEKNSPIDEKTAKMPMLSSRPFTLVTPQTAKTLGTTCGIYIRADGKPMFNEFESRNTFSPPGKHLDSASITINNYGKGKVCYIATDVFESYAGGSQWYMKNLVKNIINNLFLGDKSIIINAPGYVEISLAKRDNELHIHLVNLVREWPASNFGSAVEYTICEDIIPIHNIEIVVPSEYAPSEVTINNSTELPFSYENSKIKFTLNRLDIHECIIIKGLI